MWTGDEGLITAESLLEVARPVFSSFSSGGEPISLVEQIKLSDELLNYQQPGNCGLMSFMDYAAWHSRIPQVSFALHSSVLHLGLAIFSGACRKFYLSLNLL
jgi:hypothetical protein